MSAVKKSPKPGGVDLSKCCKSTFTLTFAIEVVGIDVFHDCNEGWLDLGSGPVQGMKLQYQLAPGQNFDCDILIWPHTAKIWCGMQNGWVRTWFFLQRRWLAFSITHAFPVRVEDYRSHVASVTPVFGLASLSSNARNDSNAEVYLPELSFGDRRQFAPVIEAHQSLISYLHDLIWSLVEEYIPASYMDGPFDIPHAVKDKRHQDAVIQYVQETILNRQLPKDPEEIVKQEAPPIKSKGDVRNKDIKEKKKVPEVLKYEIVLSGDTILSGSGRIVPFGSVGEKPHDIVEVIALIASAGLPAQDDLPIVFINIGKLTDIPVEALEKQKITHIYTKWIINDEEHISKQKNLQKSKRDIDFDDHHAVPIPYHMGMRVINRFLDREYRIELRGIRTLPPIDDTPTLFGYAKGDRDFGITVPPKAPDRDTDILIGITKIYVRQLTKVYDGFVKGEYPIYPPDLSLKPLERDGICTNDINAVRVPFFPKIVVPAGVILEAQMTLEVSIGLVGCKPPRMGRRYSRLFALVSDAEAIMTILRHIAEINDQVRETGERDDLLTGFALDTGDNVLLYVEGPRDGQILVVWELTEDFYPKMKPVFSTAAKYHRRLYPELPQTAMPFNILKMFVPLSVLLACPPIYARPALPLPTRLAVLKIGRLLAGKLTTIPSSRDMPTMMELRSFRLELCVAPHSPPVALTKITAIPNKLVPVFPDPSKASSASVQRINWENPDSKKRKDSKSSLSKQN